MQKCSPEANASLTRFCMGLYKRACEKNESFFMRPFTYGYNNSYIT